MPRMSKEDKARSHAKIIEEAARLFREKGIEATGVGEVMSAAGLTHGGFYRHFGSKEELAVVAIEWAVEEACARLERDISKLGASTAIASYIEQYLTEHHVLMRAKGCPLAAFGGEVGYGPAKFQISLTTGAERIVALIARGVKGNKQRAQSRATCIFATLVGTIILARAADTPEAIRGYLAAGRQCAEVLRG